MKQTTLFKLEKFLFFAVIFLGMAASAFTLWYAIKYNSFEAFILGFAAICIASAIFLIFNHKYIKS